MAVKMSSTWHEPHPTRTFCAFCGADPGRRVVGDQWLCMECRSWQETEEFMLRQLAKAENIVARYGRALRRIEERRVAHGR